MAFYEISTKIAYNQEAVCEAFQSGCRGKAISLITALITLAFVKVNKRDEWQEVGQM